MKENYITNPQEIKSVNGAKDKVFSISGDIVADLQVPGLP